MGTATNVPLLFARTQMARGASTASDKAGKARRAQPEGKEREEREGKKGDRKGGKEEGGRGVESRSPGKDAAGKAGRAH